MPQNEKVELEGWRVERMQRSGNAVLIVYKDGTACGQITLNDEKDVEKWLTAIKSLSSKP